MDNDDIKEEIKRRADLVAIISQYVPLQRAGQRYKARCPFHQEKTPSFFVDPAGGFWKCFGCGAGGDVFSFLMKIEGLTFPEAGERLAQQLGLQWRRQPGDTARSERRRLLQRALEQATGYFQSQLNSARGAAARQYLAGRDLREETIKEFRLGYALPEWDGLVRHLAAKGLSMDVAQEASLIKPGRQDSYYDVFRHRIIFPIEDAAGRILGFGGRTLDPKESAKYLNSGDTPLFRKGHHVYGLPQARQAMTQAGVVVLVEGYTDVLALHQAGFANVVASLGTALTEDHVRLLGRYVETVVMCYDADTAGRQAALRNLEVFERVGVEAQVVVLPGDTDPDDFIRGRGLEAWQALLEKRLSLAEYQLEMVFARYRDQGPEGLSQAAARAVEVLLKVRNRVKRDELIARAADYWGGSNPGRTQAMQRALRLELSRRAPRSPRQPRRVSDAGLISQTLSRQGEAIPPWRWALEGELLSLALQDEDWCRRLFELLQESDFSPGPHGIIAAALWWHLQAGGEFAPHQLVDNLPEEGGCRSRAVELLLTPLPGDAEEEILISAEKLHKHRGVAGVQEKYEVREPTEKQGPQAGEEAEDFEELRARVSAGLARGELNSEDPDYRRYCELVARFHGRGQYDFFPSQGPLGKNVGQDQEDLLSSESEEGS